MKKHFKKIILIFLVPFLMFTTVKPKQTKAFAITGTIATLAGVALVGALGYKMILPQDKQVSVTEALKTLVLGAQNSHLPTGVIGGRSMTQQEVKDWLLETGTKTVATKEDTRKMADLIKNYLISMGMTSNSIVLNGDSLVNDTIPLDVTSGVFTLASYTTGGYPINSIRLYEKSYPYKVSTSFDYGYHNYVIYSTYSEMGQFGLIQSFSGFNSLTQSYQTFPTYIYEATPTRVQMPRPEKFEFKDASLFAGVVGQQAYAGYTKDELGRSVYKTQTIKDTDRVLFIKHVNTIPFPDNSNIKQYDINGLTHHMWNASGKGYQTVIFPYNAGSYSYITERSLLTMQSNARPYKNNITITADKPIGNVTDTDLETNIEKLPVSIPLSGNPTWDIPKTWGDNPVLDNPNDILNDNTNTDDNDDEQNPPIIVPPLDIDLDNTFPKFPDFTDSIPSADFSGGLLSGLFGWLLGALKGLFGYVGNVIGWLGNVLIYGLQWLLNGILAGLKWLVDALIKGLSDLFNLLFKPTLTLEYLIPQIKAKFPIVDQLSGFISSLLTGLNASNSKPVFQFEYYGTHNLIDFSIFDKYLIWFKSMVSFFISFRFIKWLSDYVPKLLGGI